MGQVVARCRQEVEHQQHRAATCVSELSAAREEREQLIQQAQQVFLTGSRKASRKKIRRGFVLAPTPSGVLNGRILLHLMLTV